MIEVDSNEMDYFYADSCAISPSAFLFNRHVIFLLSQICTLGCTEWHLTCCHTLTFNLSIIANFINNHTLYKILLEIHCSRNFNKLVIFMEWYCSFVCRMVFDTFNITSMKRPPVLWDHISVAERVVSDDRFYGIIMFLHHSIMRLKRKDFHVLKLQIYV